jgi:hypothetical protein
VGQNTEEVLREVLGCSEDRLQKFRDAGVFGDDTERPKPSEVRAQ